MNDIKISSNNNQTSDKLSKILDPLIEDRKLLLDKKISLDASMNSMKNEISMIDAEILSILHEHDINEFKGLGIHAQIRAELSPKIVDFKKVFEWIETNNKWDFLRSDFLKRRDVINALEKEGLNIDGVEMRTYTKFKIK